MCLTTTLRRDKRETENTSTLQEGKYPLIYFHHARILHFIIHNNPPVYGIIIHHARYPVWPYVRVRAGGTVVMLFLDSRSTVSYTHLRAHETPEQLVCRLLLEKKKKNII